MPLRVYACFAAAGSKNPAHSDLGLYFLLRAWAQRAPLANTFDDVHAQAPRFDPKQADMQAVLGERLRTSALMLLILSARTKASAGWMNWEIDFAARECALPIVCAYASLPEVDQRRGHAEWWPQALHRAFLERPLAINHVAFRPAALAQMLAVAPWRNGDACATCPVFRPQSLGSGLPFTG